MTELLGYSPLRGKVKSKIRLYWVDLCRGGRDSDCSLPRLECGKHTGARWQLFGVFDVIISVMSKSRSIEKLAHGGRSNP